jgi:hypothetical protein
MNKITTNYPRPSKFVLIDDEHNVVAIINISKDNDITEQVRRAIKEHLTCNQVVFEQDINIGDFEFGKEVPFIYSDEDEQEYSYVFELIKTEEY